MVSSDSALPLTFRLCVCLLICILLLPSFFFGEELVLILDLVAHILGSLGVSVTHSRPFGGLLRLITKLCKGGEPY